VGKDGQKQRITESKNHVIEWFKPGQEVEVILSPYGDHRLAGFYSLYFRDLCILGFGLCFILVPLLIGKGILPTLDTPAGAHLEKFAIDQYNLIASARIGPITVRTLMKGMAVFVALTAVIGLAGSLAPFVDQLHLGFGWGLIEALENQRFDEARELILRGKGINKVDEFNRNPLLLALEAGQFDLARLLVEAGAEVNIESKMNKTPLQVAAQAGELNMVKVLLSKGASPDMPEDRLPPVFYALAEKHHQVARILLESKCDLNRVYVNGDTRFTVGDMTVMARRPDLTALVRRRGGSFTRSP
jgi:hypothetical protein